MITKEIQNGVVRLTIDNQSKANSLTAGMLQSLIDEFNGASQDQSVRGVLLTASGDRAFSAGMDTAQFEHSSSTLAYETISLLGEVCAAAKNCAVPIAVAMNGYCIGGALEISAAADFRVATPEAWFSMPEVRLGIPSVLESVNLHRLMGWTKASELILTGNRFTADQMEHCGFLNVIVPGDELLETALSYLWDTAESSRETIAQQKQLFATWKNTSENIAIRDSRKEFALAFARKNDQSSQAN